MSIAAMSRRVALWGFAFALGTSYAAGAAPPRHHQPVREEEDSALVVGANKAAWELWGLRPMGDLDACFCPLGLSESLALLEAASHGVSSEEICRWYAVSPADYEREWPALFQSLKALRPALSQSNWLWFRESQKIVPSFKQKITASYSAELQPVDFSKPQEAVHRINGVVDGATNGRVKDFLTARDIDTDTQVVMSNVVNFEGEWVHPFDPAVTKPRPFRLLDGNSEMLPTMGQVGEFAGLLQQRGEAMEDFDLLEMPYKGQHLVMDIFEPTGESDVTRLEKTLNFEKVTGYLQRLDEQQPTMTSVSLPRLQIQARAELGLRLRQLGLVNLFGPQADLSRMLVEGKGVHVSGVVQQVNISVDEVGTKASAVTASFFARAVVPTFIVDRPFLFLVRDKKTGLVVFIGRYCGPKFRSS